VNRYISESLSPRFVLLYVYERICRPAKGQLFCQEMSGAVRSIRSTALKAIQRSWLIRDKLLDLDKIYRNTRITFVDEDTKE